jgi:transporter family protein
MNYILWAIIAMLAYGCTAVLLKFGLKQTQPIVAVVITNLILVGVGCSYALLIRADFSSLTQWNWNNVSLVAAGLMLGLSIISYYTALSRGPASIVVPIFAMSFCIVVVLGLLFLGEQFTITKAIGIILAIVAIILLAL